MLCWLFSPVVCLQIFNFITFLHDRGSGVQVPELSQVLVEDSVSTYPGLHLKEATVPTGKKYLTEKPSPCLIPPLL